MKMLLRASAALLLVGAAACADMPTAAAPEMPLRRDGWGIGGGHITAETDTLNVFSADQSTSGTTCLDERGGWGMGGGHLVDPAMCP